MCVRGGGGVKVVIEPCKLANDSTRFAAFVRGPLSQAPLSFGRVQGVGGQTWWGDMHGTHSGHLWETYVVLLGTGLLRDAPL